MIFTIYYVAAMVLVAAEMAGMLRTARVLMLRRAPLLWTGILVATYATQIALLMRIAQAGPWPLPVVQWQPGQTMVIVDVLAIGLLQAYALLGLYRTGAPAAMLWSGGAVMLLLSVVAPVLTNADLYAYVGNALLGLSAYTPPHARFPGDLASINVFWNAPRPPTTYGPLWIAIARLVTTGAPSLLSKLLALRALSALLFVALVLLLRAYGLPARALVLVVLNPALYFEFVLNGHNDLLPVTVVVAAAIVARTRPAIAAALVAAAALVKIPYVLLGLPVLRGIVDARSRWSACIATVIAALGVSWLAGGRAYFDALSRYVSTSHLETVVHAIAALAAAGAIVAAVAGLRRLRSAVWLIPMIGAYTASWYALWSFPYALGARRVLVYFLLWLPFVTMLSEPTLVRQWTLTLVVPATVILALAIPPRTARAHGGPSYK
jgi:hypothetical protein